MIAQYSAASLVSENKVLAHPASVDSIPTGANSEDHNSMATIAARKLRTIARNAQSVLALEMMCAAQAVDWRAGMNVDPNETRSDDSCATTSGNGSADAAWSAAGPRPPPSPRKWPPRSPAAPRNLAKAPAPDIW